MHILRKIWKYKFHYVVVIPALLLIVAYKGVPLVTAFVSAFKDYAVFRGLADSPWVGWSNFRDVFRSGDFGRILVNTIGLKLLYIVLSGGVALMLALALSGIRSARVRSAFASLFLLPYFIPTIVIVNIALMLLSVNQSPLFRWETLVLAEPGAWRAAFLAVEIVSTAGIPAMIALAAIYAGRAGAGEGAGARERSFATDRALPALRAVLAFSVLQLSALLTADFDLIYALYNPIVADVADTFDTYLFRTGLISANFSAAAAVWVIRFALQLVLAAAAYLLVRRWFLRDLFGGGAERRAASAAGRAEAAGDALPDAAAAERADGARGEHSPDGETASLDTVEAADDAVARGTDDAGSVAAAGGSASEFERGRNGGGSVAGWSVALAYGAVVAALLYFLAVYPFVAPDGGALRIGDALGAGNYIQHLIATLLIVVLYMLMTVTLAYPLTVRDLPGRGLYKAFLLVILVMGSGGIHEYLYFRNVDMVGNVFTPALSGLVSVIGVFVLKSIFNARYAELKEQASAGRHGEMHAFFTLFIPKVWKPLLALGALQFVTIWNAYQPSLMYAFQPDGYSPAGTVYVLTMAGTQSGVVPADVLKIGLVVSLPAIVLFLLFRRWLTSEVMINETRNL